MIFTNTGLTKDNIIFDFDISNTKSYDSNTGFTLTSLTFWEDYILSDLTLTGYGQTMYDFGLATSTSFTETKSYTIKDRNLILNRIGYNNAIGNTTFPQIILTSSTEGNSFVLSGGYLTSFFKLHDKTFQLAKYRNENGFTIDSWVYIDQNTFDKITSYTEGFFIYLGTKAENKFNVIYSASTDNLGTGFTYDTNNYLNDIEFNAVGFKFNNDKTISLRYLEVSGLATEYKSTNILTTTGWTNIGFTFRYCDKIRDNYADSKGNSLLDCVSLRKGHFKIFVNGKLFHEENNIDEFLWLKSLDTDGDRQIGLPYTINWGGGSWGLKHSFIPSITSYTAYSAITTGTTYIITSGATNILVDGNYGTFEGASGTTSGNTSGVTTDVYSSILTATTAITYTGTNSLLLYASPSAITNVIITGFTYTGTTNIISGGNSGSFEGTVTGITTDLFFASIITSTTQVFSGTNSLYLSAETYSSLTDNLLYFTRPISLEPNKRYLYEGKFYDDSTFPATSDTKGVYLQLLNPEFGSLPVPETLNSENIILSSVTYTSTTSANTWVDLKFYFQTPLIITGGSQYQPAVKIVSSGITGSCNFYFDDFKIIKQDYVQTSSAQTEITGYTYTPLSNIITNGDNGTFQSNINGMSTPLTNGTLNQVVGASNYLGLYNNGGSVGGFSNVNGYSFVRFNTALNLSANTKYVFSGSVWDYTQTYTSNRNIFLGFLDGFETSCNTITSVTFNSGSTDNNFYDLYYEFITPSSGTSNKTLTIKTDNTTLFNTNFFLFFDNFKLIPHTTNPQTAFTTSFTFSTLTNNLVVFNTPINISPNKTYIYQGKFYDDNSWSTGSSKNVYLTFSGGLNSEITVVTSVTYTSETSAATWNDLKLVFITPSGLTGTTSYTPVIKVDYTTGITAGYKFYFDEFSIAEYDLTNLTGLTGYSVTEQILLNKNVESIIKDNFDGSFHGKIQKLRMYDIDLNFSEIKKNYNYYSTKYGFTKLK
jgi:hypothetical protein